MALWEAKIGHFATLSPYKHKPLTVTKVGPQVLAHTLTDTCDQGYCADYITSCYQHGQPLARLGGILPLSSSTCQSTVSHRARGSHCKINLGSVHN